MSHNKLWINEENNQIKVNFLIYLCGHYPTDVSNSISCLIKTYISKNMWECMPKLHSGTENICIFPDKFCLHFSQSSSPDVSNGLLILCFCIVFFFKLCIWVEREIKKHGDYSTAN